MKLNLIIDGRQTKGKRIFEYFITVAGWIYIFGFLTQVIISILLWGVGIHYLRKFIISNEYFTQTVHLFLFTVELSVAMLCLTLYWSYYNKFRYGKLRRRKPPIDVSIDEIAASFSVSKEFIHEIRAKRWIDLDDESK